MIEIVIIGQNEGEHIQNMYNALKKYPYRRTWVLDRCTDDSVTQLISLGERFIKTPESLEGRQTSFARNLGLSICSTTSDVLFLDGDRYPVGGSLGNLEAWNKDIALFLLENDWRGNEDFNEFYYGHVLSHFYSCGIFLKRDAINKVLEFQNGELFSTELQQWWGIEDTYLGDVCYHLELTCDICRDFILQGGFDKRTLESINVLKIRLKKRDGLNVLWNW
jgi:hypothetical protein